MIDPSLPLLRERTDKAAASAKQYVLSRQGADGGFCFYRSEHVDEPNLHDTYYALAALRLLDAHVPRADALVDFLTNFKALEPNAVYYGAFALDLLGRSASIDAHWLARIREWDLPELPANGATSGWLQRTLMLLRLKRRFGELPDAHQLANFLRSLKRDGGYGGKPNLVDTWFCLSLLELLSVNAASPDTVLFVDRLQVPTFGFTTTTDSMMTNLDVVHAGVECCERLNLPVRHAADTFAYTLACQSANGGFSRTSNALPDLEQTHLGLQIITLLKPTVFAH